MKDPMEWLASLIKGLGMQGEVSQLTEDTYSIKCDDPQSLFRIFEDMGRFLCRLEGDKLYLRFK